MIRAKIAGLINSRLTNDHFNFNDFQIDMSGESKYKTKITITYEYDVQYFLHLNIPTEKTKSFREEMTTDFLGKPTTRKIEYLEFKIEGEMCPGQLSYKEEFTYNGIDGISKSITTWLNSLWEDLTISPENRIFIQQANEIEKLKEKVQGIPDEYFTIEEANILKERLDKIESQLAEKLIEQTPVKADADNQIEKLHQEIEVLKQTIHSLKKAGWFKSFITKTMNWVSDPSNQKMLKAGKDVITTFLPEAT